MKDYSRLKMKPQPEFIGSDPEKYQYECSECRGTGEYTFSEFSDDSVTQCHSCDGKGWNEYDYPVEAGPAAGCEHEDIEEGCSGPFCTGCGMPFPVFG